MEAPEVQFDGTENVANACAIYLEDHSAYVDDCLSEAEAAAHEAHAASCPSCACYADVMVRGLALVHALPDIEASAHFEERLRHRIFHIEDAAQLERSGGRSTAGIAAAALIALLAWSPVLMRSMERPITASGANLADKAQVRSSVDVMTTADRVGSRNALFAASDGSDGRPPWYVQPVSVQLDQTPVHRFVSYAGSYSPLIVSPPAARGPRAVRLVSATSQ